jgi:hypothetical protein
MSYVNAHDVFHVGKFEYSIKPIYNCVGNGDLYAILLSLVHSSCIALLGINSIYYHG